MHLNRGVYVPIAGIQIAYQSCCYRGSRDLCNNNGGSQGNIGHYCSYIGFFEKARMKRAHTSSSVLIMN